MTVKITAIGFTSTKITPERGLSWLKRGAAAKLDIGGATSVCKLDGRSDENATVGSAGTLARGPRRPADLCFRHLIDLATDRCYGIDKCPRRSKMNWAGGG